MSQAQKAVRGLVRVSHQMTKLSAAQVSQVSNNSTILGVSRLDSSPLRTLEPKAVNDGFSYYDQHASLANNSNTSFINTEADDIIGYWVDQPVGLTTSKSQAPTTLTEPAAAGAMTEEAVFSLPPLPSKRWEATAVNPARLLMQESILESK